MQLVCLLSYFLNFLTFFYFLTFLLSYFLTFLLSYFLPVHTSSLSLYRGTCAACLFFFKTLFAFYFRPVHTSSLSLYRGTCAAYFTFDPCTPPLFLSLCPGRRGCDHQRGYELTDARFNSTAAWPVCCRCCHNINNIRNRDPQTE